MIKLGLPYKRGMAACWKINRPKRRLTWVWHNLDLNLKGDHSPTQYNGVNVYVHMGVSPHFPRFHLARILLDLLL